MKSEEVRRRDNKIDDEKKREEEDITITNKHKEH